MLNYFIIVYRVYVRSPDWPGYISIFSSDISIPCRHVNDRVHGQFYVLSITSTLHTAHPHCIPHLQCMYPHCLQWHLDSLPRLHPKQKSKFIVTSHLILINQIHRLPPLSTLSHSTPPQSLLTSTSVFPPQTSHRANR